MKKKQISLSLFFSFLTHVGLFLLIIFLAYYVRRDTIEDEKGRGKGEVWIDLKSLGTGLEPTSTRVQNPNDNISRQKQSAVFSKSPQEKVSTNHDALKLRQKEKREENSGQSSEGGAGATSSSVGSGTGNGQGSGQGEGQGNSAASVLGMIRRKIEQSKRYPVLARARKIQGVSVLSFTINESGGAEKLVLVKSSGSELLDEEALSTVKRASPLPYYSLPIQISIKFSLE